MINILKNLKNNLITKHRYFTTFAFVGGAISDIVQPIAPFSLYFLFFFITACLVLFFLRKKNIFLNDYFNYSIIGLLVSLSIFSFQKVSGSEKKGLLAANFPMFENFQSTLGIIKEDIKTIKKDVKAIVESNQQISKNTEQISKGIEEINTNLKNINNDENLKIFKNPKTAMEFYSNAKFYELKGDFLNAKKSYVGFFEFKVEVYEPYINFIELLKIQEGNLIAKENFEILINKYPTKIANVLLNRFLGSYDERMKYLNNFISTNQDYLPAYLELFYVYKNKKELTSSELNQLQINLEKLVLALEQGKLNSYFVDKKLNIKFLEEIRPFYNQRSKEIDKNKPKRYFEIVNNMDRENNTSNLNFFIEIKEKFSDLSFVINGETLDVKVFNKDKNTYLFSKKISNLENSDMNIKTLYKYKDASNTDVKLEENFNLAGKLSEFFIDGQSSYVFRCATTSIFYEMSETNKIPFNRVSWGNGFYFNTSSDEKNGNIKLLLSIYNPNLKLGIIDKVSIEIDRDKPIIIEEYFKDKNKISHLVLSFEKNLYMKGIGRQLNYFGIAIGKKFEQLKIIFFLKNGEKKEEMIKFQDLTLEYQDQRDTWMTNKSCLEKIN